MNKFRDRADAGRRLGQQLSRFRGEDVVILGLPRGGVPVAAEVAKALNAPLDVIVVRKLGVPFRPEVAMGAIGEGNARVLDQRVISLAGITEDDLRTVEREARALLKSRVERYRRARPRLELTGKTALIVDDGMATGSTARVACQVARQLGAATIILAVPVAPAHLLETLTDPDEVVSLISARDFQAVGQYYRDFSPTADEEVMQLLDALAQRDSTSDSTGGKSTGGGQDAADDQEVEIPAAALTLQGDLHLPAHCEAVVVFAHGSGSSRHSPRNRYVASILHDAGLGTLLLDLLTPAEEADRGNVFDIPLLAQRLTAATRWLASHYGPSMHVAYFGASTGAAAALWAAADAGSQVGAIVSRGGRPDLAGPRLAAVRAPTLLIVGGADTQVLALNRAAMNDMRGLTRLEIVPGATHLFEEPGTLAQAAKLAAGWFTRYLLPARDGVPLPEGLP
ncbi:phosphoribosyltransferase family protein [Pseudarthrobacter sulfonivorans]|uniref:phosphoribosyltransferase family protein n=1 Tax=Pseudarthrobacter sulfonivorans TaxID=121292 RepID=UPI00168B48A6|nr:phosphoribosyltransferase family protein [Pseudarthrobacter sulfonivorans]